MDHPIEPRVREQTIAEADWEEGWLKGYAEGFAEGRLKVFRGYLCDLLVHRFGPLPETLSQAIKAVTDAERLSRAFRKALRLENLADLDL